MIILVINTGSSSLKYKLMDMERETVLASGVIERIGEPSARVTHNRFPDQAEAETRVIEQAVPDHHASLHLSIRLMTSRTSGVIRSIDQIGAVGHRVVQGGKAYNRAALIDDAVVAAIRKHNPLAPLHNPANVTGIEVSQTLLPAIPQVAVFDTGFHQTMPPAAFLYPLPYDYYTETGIRRYGFHGTSHKYVFSEAALDMGQRPEDSNVITLHLGNGCSMAAVKEGRCVDTTMGLTPLAGLMMGTRCGDIDPAIIFHLAGQTGLTLDRIYEILNSHSGLKGICGHNDMRDIRRLAAQGDQRAGLALEMFTYRIKKYVGAYCAVLGRVDALVFTAGIGENDVRAREDICRGLDALGIDIDQDANRSVAGSRGPVHKEGSRVQIRVIPTNEELQIARETAAVLGG